MVPNEQLQPAPAWKVWNDFLQEPAEQLFIPAAVQVVQEPPWV